MLYVTLEPPLIATHLSWNHHCKSVASKATRCFNVLRQTTLAALIKLNLLPFLPWFFQFLNTRLQYGLHTVSKEQLTEFTPSPWGSLHGSVTVVMTLHATNASGYHLLQAVVRPYTGNPCLFVVMYLLLSQPMTSFTITHASLRILCLLLSAGSHSNH